MELPAFRRSLSGAEPPQLAPALVALWWAARGDWDHAHAVVTDDEGAACAWVHAYLHRVEGDLDNAAYWYRRARRVPASSPLDAEWEAIAVALLGDGDRS
jgi:hypothetical protein